MPTGREKLEHMRDESILSLARRQQKETSLLLKRGVKRIAKLSWQTVRVKLDIPSRSEISELSQRMERLNHQIADLEKAGSFSRVAPPLENLELSKDLKKALKKAKKKKNKNKEKKLKKKEKINPALT